MSVRLHPDDVARLRDALAPFTVDAAYELLGADAHRALMRNETTPAKRMTRDADAVGTLIRLFSLQLSVHRAEAQTALPGLIDSLCRAGILATDEDRVRALVDIRPYGDENHDWWVICDLTPNLDGARRRRMAADHVLGISSASSTLASLAVRKPNASALDLGTGCGVQALHLAEHSDTVVATDVNERALDMARLTAALNGLDIDVRSGSLYEPVAGDTFDQIVTNPPFVVSPPGSEKLTYRDSGLPGDEVVRRVLSAAPDHLAPDGWCQILANWVHPSDTAWQERVHAWLEPTGLDAWVMEREVIDPASYVELWLADAGLDTAANYTDRYDAWLSWLEGEGIEAIGFGWICARNSGRDAPEVRIEHWAGHIEGPAGPEVSGWADTVETLSRITSSRGDVLDEHWRVADGVVEERVGEPAADDPQTIVACRTYGMCRRRGMSTVEAGFLAACDGELSARQISRALAELTGGDGLEVDTQIRRAITEMARDGFIQVSQK